MVAEINRVLIGEEDLGEYMEYCCVCGRKDSSINSYVYLVGDDGHRYCSNHKWIGKLAQKRAEIYLKKEKYKAIE